MLYGYYMDMKLDVKEIFGWVNIFLKSGCVILLAVSEQDSDGSVNGQAIAEKNR